MKKPTRQNCVWDEYNISYRFPKDKEERERERERERVSNDHLNVTYKSLLYQVHWPSNLDTQEIHRKMHPPNLRIVCPGLRERVNTAVQRDIKKVPVVIKIKLMMK